tara:strand:- start:8567 stop:8866 length:300 start_codon:yes stop_codon:yes gene_type:complete
MVKKINIFLPAALQPYADGQKIIEFEPGPEPSCVKLGDVMEAFFEKYGELASRMKDKKGQLHRHINLFVNDEDMRFMQELDTIVTDSDEIHVILAISGG